MAKIQLEILSCEQCPNRREDNPWSSDGWDRMIDWFCSATATPENKLGRKIAGSVEWTDKVAIPNWCPIKVPRAEPLRLIGLDLDGVVVTEKHAAKMYKEGHALGTAAYLQPELIALVDQIAERAKAEILLTTAWQAKLSVEKITEMLVAQGLKAKVFGGVGTTHKGYDNNDDTRYQATNNWLVRYPEVQSIVLLDDEPWKWNQLKVGTPSPLPHDPSVASFQRPLLDAGNGLVSWNEPGWLKHKFVLTSWEQGLTQHNVDLAVDILLDPSRGGVLPKKNV